MSGTKTFFDVWQHDPLRQNQTCQRRAKTAKAIASDRTPDAKTRLNRWFLVLISQHASVPRSARNSRSIPLSHTWHLAVASPMSEPGITQRHAMPLTLLGGAILCAELDLA
eukprot:1778670-Rhodomonas_salina.3